MVSSWIVRGLAALVLVTGFGSAARAEVCAKGLKPIAVGFSLGFTHVDMGAAAQCRQPAARNASGPERAVTSARDNILMTYNLPDVRRQVMNDLSEMARAGARRLRAHLWYRHAEDRAMTARLTRVGDPLGLAVANRGALSSRVVQNISSYFSDAFDVGYRNFVLVVSAQGTSSPKCREGEWGGCYDNRFDTPSWDVIAQIRGALSKGREGARRVVLDISPEGCFNPRSKLLVEKNLEHYSNFMVKRYVSRFRDGNFIMSCAAARAQRVLPQLDALDEMFRALDTRPESVDVHLYETKPKEIYRVLERARKTADHLGVPLDINETYSDNLALFALLRQTRIDVRGLSIFPRTRLSHCQIDVPPPYPVMQLRRAINGARACRGD